MIAALDLRDDHADTDRDAWLDARRDEAIDAQDAAERAHRAVARTSGGARGGTRRLRFGRPSRDSGATGNVEERR